MDFSWAASSEMLLMFIVLAAAVYNLISTKREIRRDREKAAREKLE
jgi:hypothetical protein